MYTGFNLKNIEIAPNSKYYKTGQSLFLEQNNIVRPKLKQYITTNEGIIDGEKIQADWFPAIEADIFISHSHTDEKLALSLAGWLYEYFGLKSFIDSCVWGYSNNLLKEIDDKYCKNTEGDTYNYEKRNYSTSHVHMLLMSALNKMIDKTECIFFLNTQNSVSLHNIKSKTLSPWIYGEIETTRIIKKRIPIRHQNITRSLEKGEQIFAKLDENLKISYPLDIKHLRDINNEILKEWRKNFVAQESHSLDKLYKITNIL